MSVAMESPHWWPGDREPGARPSPKRMRITSRQATVSEKPNNPAALNPMSTGQVASALGLTPAAISAMASRLEAGGYARREMDPTDRRRVLLHASAEGNRQAFGLFDDLYAAAHQLLAAYPEDDVRMLAALLRGYRELIQEPASQLARDSSRRPG